MGRRNRRSKQKYSNCNDGSNCVSDVLQPEKNTPVEQNPDNSNHNFFGPDDFARCSLMIVVVEAEQYLKKLAAYITENKTSFETLWEFAQTRMRSQELKKFTNDQIRVLKENQGFDYLDLTLLIRWVEVFIVFNKKLNGNNGYCKYIIETIKKVKNVRNDLCHSRKYYTKSKCFDVADDMKKIFGELFEILRNWEISMDISEETNKINTEIDTIMNADISKNNFNYMRLQKVLNHVVGQSLNKVVKLTCHNKIEDNFLQFFKNNSMTSRNFKDAFCKEEQDTLKSNSVGVELDATLCIKIIEICKNWHDILGDEAKKKLSDIIKKIKDIRNYISHNIFTISQEKCTTEANNLGFLLEDLAKFALEKNMYKGLNVCEIDIEQNYTDIKTIMSLRYPYS